MVQMDGQKQQASSCEGLVGLSLLRMSKLSQEILKFWNLVAASSFIFQVFPNSPFYSCMFGCQAFERE